MIIAFVGSGGKTTTIHEYRDRYLQDQKKVFITTSTHMRMEEDTLVSDDAEEIIERLEREGCVMVGNLAERPEDNAKIKALSRETYEAVCEHADVVLIEADGSKGLPLKYPNEYEPIIYENVDEIVVVCGLNGMGRPAKEVCHRMELVKTCLGIEENTIIDAGHVQKLLEEGYLRPLERCYPNKRLRVTARRADTLYLKALKGLLEARKEVSLIDKAWFGHRPKLIICGGGHVSLEVADVAARLDFYVKVIDDREEFANPGRFSLA